MGMMRWRCILDSWRVDRLVDMDNDISNTIPRPPLHQRDGAPENWPLFDGVPTYEDMVPTLTIVLMHLEA